MTAASAQVAGVGQLGLGETLGWAICCFVRSDYQRPVIFANANANVQSRLAFLYSVRWSKYGPRFAKPLGELRLAAGLVVRFVISPTAGQQIEASSSIQVSVGLPVAEPG